MRLVCPSCGAIHSAEAWMNDANARQCMKLIGEMPDDVSKRVLAYLALFRPRHPEGDKPSRGLAWQKALRLLAEIDALVRQAHIQWNGRVARPNSPRAWGQAMERILEHPPRQLPLKSHGYLHSIAYDIANDMDRQQEYAASPVPNRPDAPAAGCVTYPAEPERLHLDPDSMRQMWHEAKGKKTRTGDS